jgi:heme A synthase
VVAPPVQAERPSSWGRAGSLWIALIILDLGSGALFASRDAISVWRGFPGYEAGVLPPLDRLTAYAPWWLNFTFNQYMIQLVHRTLSIGLWVAMIADVVRTSQCRAGVVALIALMTAQMAAGVATLWLGGSAVAFFLHEVGAIFLLAGALVILGPGRTMPRADQG